MPPHTEQDPVDWPRPAGSHFSISPDTKILDSVQLAELERSFRVWVEASPRADVRRSRQRVLLIFLLLRYTAAKLHEVLELEQGDIDLEAHMIRLGRSGGGEGGAEESRAVEISGDLAEALRVFLSDQPSGMNAYLFRIDPGHVRRKFYERAEACGLPREFGSPSALRRSRSVELLRGNLPLPVVQKLLGHSSPNLTASLVDVSEEEMQQTIRRYIERESKRRTSARNIFFGKITEIVSGDIQSQVLLLTLGGLRITSIITNASLDRMRLKAGALVSAEIKAPWVLIAGPEGAEGSSAENRLPAIVAEVKTGVINTELLLRLTDGTEICSVITTASYHRLGLRIDGQAWVLFGAYSVILNIE